MFKFSLRWKIQLALASLSILPLGVALFLFSGLTENLLHRDMQILAEKTANFIDRSTAASRQEIENYISLLSSSADMVNSVFYASLTSETEQLQELADMTRERYQFDLLTILDAQGQEILRSSQDNQATDHSPQENPAIQGSMAGEMTSALTLVEGHLAVSVAAPVQLQGQTAGHLVGTVFLDDAFAERIKALSGTEVAFFAGSRLVAASHPQLRSFDLTKIFRQENPEVALDRSSFRIFHQKLSGGDGGILLALDRSTEIASRDSMRKMLFYIIIAAGALALGVGFAISRYIVHPLSKVVDSLQEIAEGEGDLTLQLEVNSKDEVGELAGNFNRFVERLREMVGRTRSVSEGILSATVEIRHSSQDVSAGAQRQTQALDDSFKALQGIEEAAIGIAASTDALLESVEESSSATSELGAAADRIADQMERLFSLVDQVSSSLVEMSTVSQQVAGSVQTLSSSTETSASSLSQLDVAIQQIEENAQQTKQLAEAAVQDACKGRETVGATIRGIGSIQQMVSEATCLIEDLGHQSESIGGILTVIDDVADQTNLLALNATIIAAQAGEHGRGFAVVAQEIRQLAERTAGSTREISRIIDRLQTGVGKAVQVMTAGNAQVQEEVKRSSEADKALEKIQASTNISTEQVRRIVQSTQEQAKESQQITRSINEIASMLNQFSGALQNQTLQTDHLAKASEAMRSIASEVKQSTGEQASGSRQISASMEEVRLISERINTATREQGKRSQQAVKAVAEIRVVAEANASRTAKLDQVVDHLSVQANSLEKEVGAFRA